MSDPIVDKVRVDNADPLKLFTAIRRATHEAGIPKCQFVSQQCIQWPIEWGDHPWSGVARGVDLADLTRRSDKRIARSKPELMDLARDMHDLAAEETNCPPCRTAGPDVKACSHCKERFRIPYVRLDKDTGDPWLAPAEPDCEDISDTYFRHFPFHFVWHTMGRGSDGELEHPGPGTVLADSPHLQYEVHVSPPFYIKIEDYVAGSGSMTFAVHCNESNREFWGWNQGDWVRPYQEFCRDFATYLRPDPRGDDAQADTAGPPPPKRHRGGSAGSRQGAVARGRAAHSTAAPKCRVMLAFDDIDFGDVCVVDADHELTERGQFCRPILGPSVGDDDILSQLRAFARRLGQRQPEADGRIDSLACVTYRSIREYAASINYPLDYLRLLYPREFASVMVARGEIRGAIQTIERFIWATLYNKDCDCCMRRARRQRDY